jgi:NAD(P)-dependent dehydrogenase (short-subunit alcohol dehydrogenase family)
MYSSLFVQCDVTKWDDQLQLFEKAKSFSPTGRVHYVIANAGITGHDDVFTFDGK